MAVYPVPPFKTPAAQVTVAPIQADDEEGHFSEMADPTAIWADYMVINKYEDDQHVYMMGITSPNGDITGDTAAFVQLATKTLIWITDWTACRWKEKPEIPDPESRDPNWILLDAVYEPAQETIGPDGVTPLWRMSGTYIYGRKKVDTVRTLRTINFPRPPWLEDFADRTVPETVLRTGISDIGGSYSLTT